MGAGPKVKVFHVSGSVNRFQPLPLQGSVGSRRYGRVDASCPAAECAPAAAER